MSVWVGLGSVGLHLPVKLTSKNPSSITENDQIALVCPPPTPRHHPTDPIMRLDRYGLIVADNGTPWYITGEAHCGWGWNEGAVFDSIQDIKKYAIDVNDWVS